MTITLEQAWGGGSGVAADNASRTYAATPTNLSLLLAATRGTNAATNASIPGWTQATSAVWGGTGQASALFYKIAGDGEATTITVTWTGSTQTRIAIAEYRGIDINTPLDQVAHTDHVGLVTSRSTGTTAATKGGLAVGYWTMNATTGGGESYTNGFTQQLTTGSLFYVATNSIAWNATAECTESWTNSIQCGALIATFREAVLPQGRFNPFF